MANNFVSSNGLPACWLMVVASSILFTISCSAQTTHNVGDSLGWNIPPLGEVTYRTWAEQQNFQLGDNLTFIWSGTHDVVQVTRQGYQDCSASTNDEAPSPIQTTSPATFTINSTETHYYICTINNHCDIGMRLNVQVGSSAPSSSVIKTGALSIVLLAFTIFISLLNYM